LVGNLPIAWPYLGYAALPLTRRLGRLYAAADRAWAGGIAAHVLERRGEPTPVLRKPRVVIVRAGQESEIPNFKGSYLGRFPLVSADFWTSDHLSERSRSVDAFSGTRARGTLTLKRH
jgi:hypothetical protein